MVGDLVAAALAPFSGIISGVLGLWILVCALAWMVGGRRSVERLNASVVGGALGLVGGILAAALGAVAGLLRGVVVAGAPVALSAVLGFARPRRVADPTGTPLVGRVAADPGRVAGLEALGPGNHMTPAGVVPGVHMVTVAMSDAGKGQTIVNYQIQHQLTRTAQNLIVIDAKASAPLTAVARAYLGPKDRLYVYSMHSRDLASSSLRLFADPERLADVAYMLCDESGLQDSHWNDKAAELIEAVARALTALRWQAERAAARFGGGAEAAGPGEEEITASLNEVHDHVIDREKLAELRRLSPLVDNVADNEKEWGYIRSTAARRLKPLAARGLRRVFAAGEDTEQPDFGPSPDGGRAVVIVRPDPKSAQRLGRYVSAVLDVLYRLAAEGGDAGGPGTKVIVDEAASYMRIANLGEYLDLGRESGVQLHYVLQSATQLAARLKDRDQAEHLIGSTEVKAVGATGDPKTAQTISRLSGRSTVHYRGPVRKGHILGDWREKEKPNVTEEEILAQKKGEWTVQYAGDALRLVRVGKEHYHYRQAAGPREHEIRGVVEGDHRAPGLLREHGQDSEKEQGDGAEPPEAPPPDDEPELDW